jgi:hypothetical protein
MGTDKKQILDRIISELDTLNGLHDKLEILANIFMIYGVEEMLDSTEELNSVTPENVVNIVIQDIKSKGNTVGNSLAMQGITILEWLDRI